MSGQLYLPSVFDNSYTGDGRHCESFTHLCGWCSHRYGVGLEFVAASMYTVTLASWLSVHLAERSSRLDYQQVWHSSDPLRLILAAWSISLNFDHIRRARVQRKVFRFIDTSYLLSTRRSVIRVATHSLVVVRHVKRMLRVLLAAVRRNHYHELSLYL